MQFNTIVFVLVFLLFILVSRTSRRPGIILGLFNLFFVFATGILSGVYFILTVVGVYYVAIKLNNTKTEKRRFIYFLIGVVFLVFNLFLMKLKSLPDGFVNINANLGYMLRNIQIVGISFYSFTCLYYLTDIYVEKIEAERKFSDFFLFVSFFPVLLSGPIIRAEDTLPQIKEYGIEKQNWDILYSGFVIFTIGMFKKVCLADNLAVLTARSVNFSQIHTFDAWLILYGYAFQLYFDFSGYSEMAYGVAKVLGISVPVNFRFPYLSVTFSEFWKRWHISLSNFFFEYLFTPIILTVKRKVSGFTVLSQSIFPYLFSAIITMLLVGLWHGITPNFIVWGLLMASYLVFERMFFPQSGNAVVKIIQGIVVFHLISFAWIFFRSTDLAGALSFIGTLNPLGKIGPALLLTHERLFIVLIVSMTFLAEYKIKTSEKNEELYEPVMRVAGRYIFLVVGLLWFCILNFYGAGNAFIYFKF